VGQADLSFGHHAFLFADGVMQDLGGSLNNSAAAINDSGQVVGTALHAFLYSGGTMNDLGTLGGTNSQAQGINQFGDVVGYSQLEGDGAFHAFLYTGGAMHDLGTLGGNASVAQAINSSGAVVGYSTTATATPYHAFLLSPDGMQDLGTLGGAQSFAEAVNDDGQVVGLSDSPFGQRAFLYTSGTMVDVSSLVTLDTTLVSAYGINNSGQIAAFGANGHAFLLTPSALTKPSDPVAHAHPIAH